MENIKNTIQQNFAEAQNALEQFSTPENFEKIAQAAQLMADSIKNNGKIISCGNGGSMCDAMQSIWFVLLWLPIHCPPVYCCSALKSML